MQGEIGRRLEKGGRYESERAWDVLRDRGRPRGFLRADDGSECMCIR